MSSAWFSSSFSSSSSSSSSSLSLRSSGSSDSSMSCSSLSPSDSSEDSSFDSSASSEALSSAESPPCLSDPVESSVLASAPPAAAPAAPVAAPPAPVAPAPAAAPPQHRWRHLLLSSLSRLIRFRLLSRPELFLVQEGYRHLPLLHHDLLCRRYRLIPSLLNHRWFVEECCLKIISPVNEAILAELTVYFAVRGKLVDATRGSNLRRKPL